MKTLEKIGLEIYLSQGKVALLDADDFNRLSKHKWCAMKRTCGVGKFVAGRAVVRNGVRTCELMHRVIMNAPDGVSVDHIDGNPLNNRKSNLRFATMSENLANRGKTAANSSGFKGVYAEGNKYRAVIMQNYRRYYLGTFGNPVDAAIAYDKKAIELHGEFASLNFSKGVSQ